MTLIEKSSRGYVMVSIVISLLFHFAHVFFSMVSFMSLLRFFGRSRVRIPVTLWTICIVNCTGPLSSQKAPSWILLNTMGIHYIFKTIGKTRALVRPFFSTMENSSLSFPFSHSLSNALKISKSHMAPILL